MINTNQFNDLLKSRSYNRFLLFAIFLLPIFGNQLSAQVTNELFQNSFPSPPNGPTVAPQTALTQTANGVSSNPPVTVTISYDDQQFNSVEGNPGVQGSTFGTGGRISNNGNDIFNTPTNLPVYVPMDNISGPADMDFTSCSACLPNMGISTIDNYAFNLFNSSDALIDDNTVNQVPLNSRARYSDVTLTFSRPVNDPVLQVVGLGGFYEYTTSVGDADQRSYAIGFTTDLDLITPGLSLSPLTGNAAFAVTPTTISNNRINFGAPTMPITQRGVERGAATGSVIINGTGITTVTFRVYLRGDGGSIRDINNDAAGPLDGNEVKWSAANDFEPNGGTGMQNAFTGDRYLLGVSFQRCPQLLSQSDDQDVCIDDTGDDITVTTDVNNSNSIRFVRFNTDQMAGAQPTPAEAATIYGGTPIATVTPTGASEPYTATYNYNPTDFPAPGTYYVYAILNPDEGGNCNPVREIEVTVNAVPLVEAGGPDVVCQADTPGPITLSGATIDGGASTAAWSIVSGGGTLSNTAQTAMPQTVTYTPADGFTGTVTLELTTDDPDGTCPAVTDTRTITVEEAATVEAGGSQTVCQTTNPFVITLTGSSVGGGATQASWSIVSGGGTLSNMNPTNDPASVSYTPEENFTGTVVLQLTSDTPAGSCPAVVDLRVIDIRNVDCGSFPWAGN